ncbi:MAG: DUF4231 domain-containing protein [Nostocaceae cyanobacterium]|nr:DUF4231 domain-containing protein [Nostocaceae cyanobacterium]
MTSSEMTTLEYQNQIKTADMLATSSSPSKPNNLLFLKVTEYLVFTVFACSVVLAIVIPDDKRFIISAGISLAIFIFLFLTNQKLWQAYNNAAVDLTIKKQAELYLLSNGINSAPNLILPAREKALRYSQEMINDYKRIRNLSRNFYYILQLVTIVLSGVTPILVLVDKLEAGQAWLKWLPVICPAIASIVASVVTSFPFQKNSVAANTAVELLEAEQEKFILGVTPAYRCDDASDEREQQQKAKQAIENFVIQVNNIHLNQLQQTSDSQQKQENTQQDQSSSSN